MAVANHNAFAHAVPSHMVESSHKLPALAASSSRSGSPKRITCFYMIYDHRNKDPYSFTCIALDKLTGETTEWTISPALGTKPHNAILLNFTAVAVKSTIYMIGGVCGHSICPDREVGGCHLHADVIFFDTLRPEDGWREAAPMHIPRMTPSAVVIDGLIYVLGGAGMESPKDGECFDPKTNKWRLFSAAGCDCQPACACIQVPYVDPNGVQSVLIHSAYQNVETLFAYLPGTQKWEVVSHDFIKCHRPGTILGDIIYAVVDDKEQPLRGYHLRHKQWFPVELDAGIEICTRSAWVFASGNDKLCLLWIHFDRLRNGENDGMECLELRLYTSYSYTGSEMMLNLSASKVSHTYFLVENTCFRRSIVAL